MIDLLYKNLDLIFTGLGSGILAWLFERKRKKAEVQQVEVDAGTAMQKMYKTFVSDYKEEYKTLTEKLTGMQRDILEMQIETGRLQGDISRLQEEVSHWKNKYNSLKREMNKNQ